MNRRRTWWIGGLTLAGIWLAALLGIGIARHLTMTAEKTLAYLRANPIAEKSPADRRAVIDGLAKRVNQLSFEERQQFRFEKDIRAFYESMTDEERGRYLDLTLPKGMQKAIQAFNEMPAPKRKQLVQRAVNDLQRAQTEVSREELDKALADENVKKVVEQGLKSYWSEANAAAKMDIQPLIEQIQAIMQGAH